MLDEITNQDVVYDTGEIFLMTNGLDIDVSKAGVAGVSVAKVSERKKIEKKIVIK